MKLSDFIDCWVDEYILSNFIYTDELKFYSNFLTVLRQKGYTIGYRNSDILLIVGGSHLIKSEVFLRWLILKMISSEIFSGSRSEFIEINEIKDASRFIKRILRKLMLIFDDYNDNLEERISKKEQSYFRISPFNGIDLSTFFENENKVFLKLHYYQLLAKNKILLNLGNGVKRQLLQLPTGAGKTRTAVETIVDFLRTDYLNPNNDRIILWFSHSAELCEQSFSSFVDTWNFRGDDDVLAIKFFGGNDLIKEYGDKFSTCSTKVIFTSFQQFRSYMGSSDRRKKIIFNSIVDACKLCIVDEAHISLARTYRESLDYVLNNSGSKLIGLTATPGRNAIVQGDNSNDELAQLYGREIVRLKNVDGADVERPIDYLQEKGYLARIDQKLLNIQSRVVSGSEEYSLLSDGERNFAIVSEIRNLYIENKKILVFAGSVEHAKSLKSFLSFFDVKAEFITGEMDLRTRNLYVSSFKHGDLQVLINYGVLSTGFDAPKLNVVIIARPITSVVLYSQLLGRALRGRLNGGNDRNELITIKDNLLNFPNSDFIYKYWEESWLT